ncbi:MAG TPA: hypothetical protein VFN41_06750 [Candidatus Limnocylindrales bacterium]|nr:hypothetical protein [Candidatus Limnocylindrales bacterium]
MSEQGEATHYEIRVRGVLGDTLLVAFPMMDAQTSHGDTVLVGALPDQAALHGVLAGIEALGLELLEVRRQPHRDAHRTVGPSPEPRRAESA